MQIYIFFFILNGFRNVYTNKTFMFSLHLTLYNITKI